VHFHDVVKRYEMPRLPCWHLVDKIEAGLYVVEQSHPLRVIDSKTRIVTHTRHGSERTELFVRHIYVQIDPENG